MKFGRSSSRIGMWPLLALAALLFAPSAIAQSTSATIKGTVTADKGAVAGAQVTAKNLSTGFEYANVSRADGGFQLAGLAPGTYEITVSQPEYATVKDKVEVLVSQTVTVNLRLTSADLTVENVTVFGDRIVETKTSEVATSVTAEQIAFLPQDNRNFLNFAQLAPGVRVSDDELRKEFRAQGQQGYTTNVFIDGVSFKSDTLQGGIAGQDASRGNPFPQNAVQEFQVKTQNFKAEYEKASTSIITAVTKTGGNIWAGNLFLSYQDKSFVEKNFFQERDNVDKPDRERYQGGFDVGGPIIKDKLTMFVSYEQKRQDGSNRVALGGNRPAPTAEFDAADFLPLEGEFVSPFRSKLFFGKLSWQPAADQTVDVSLIRRDESDRRSFGGEATFERGEDLQIDVNTIGIKHKLVKASWFNEASLQWQDSQWNPSSISSAPQVNYFGFVQLGSRNGDQDFAEERIALRDDFTYFLGGHTLKAGVVLNMADYNIKKTFGGNGTFNFNTDPGNGHSFDDPFEAFIATGDPSYSTDNKQFGLYFQDDWAVTPKLTLNLGLRWDYETDMQNTDFVTPPEFVTALSTPIGPDPGNPGAGTSYVWNNFSDSERANYFSNGSNRKAPKDLFAPRIGFSYDLRGNGKSTFYAGAGRYYDRDIYNVFFDEKFRLQWRTYRFCFFSNATEQAGCGVNGIAWDEAYFSRDGLLGLLAGGQVQGTPEIFLLPNDLEVPYNDQISAGYRHNFGGFIGEATVTRIHGKNGFSYIFGNRNTVTGNTVNVAPGYSNLLLGTDDREFWYNALYLKLERPFTANARWGFTATYTLSNAKQRGNDFFSLDYLTVGDFPKTPTPDDERHRVVATGIVRVPWDVVLSSNLILGSGLPYDVFDATNGFGFYEREIRFRSIRNEKKAFIVGDWWAYRQLDLRAQKTFRLPGRQSIGVILEAFNVFNWDNFGRVEGFIPPGGPAGNANYGLPQETIGPTRSFQLGITYGF